MTDIRVGDLVRGTRKTDAEQVVTGRVAGAETYSLSLTPALFLTRDQWDWEVLDRPALPIDEELIAGAKRAWLSTSHIGQQDWKAVINFVREYDKKNATKENA